MVAATASRLPGFASNSIVPSDMSLRKSKKACVSELRVHRRLLCCVEFDAEQATKCVVALLGLQGSCAPIRRAPIGARNEPVTAVRNPSRLAAEPRAITAVLPLEPLGIILHRISLAS